MTASSDVFEVIRESEKIIFFLTDNWSSVNVEKIRTKIIASVKNYFAHNFG